MDRDRENDSFDNLRPVNASLNNLNQYRASTKGYIHETQEWVDKVNGYRAKKGEPLLILKEPPRNMYISCCTYKGKRYEFGAFHYAIANQRSRLYRRVCETSGLHSCLPSELVLMILELSGHVVIRSGGIRFDIFLR